MEEEEEGRDLKQAVIIQLGKALFFPSFFVIKESMKTSCFRWDKELMIKEQKSKAWTDCVQEEDCCWQEVWWIVGACLLFA